MPASVVLGGGVLADLVRAPFRPLHDLLDTTPEIIEAHHITGDDCFMLKLLARSMTDLERLAGKIVGLGTFTTNVVYSSALPRRALVPPT